MTARFLPLLAALVLAVPLRAQDASPVQLAGLTCEHLVNPVGLGNAQPRLSWKLVSDRPGEVQTAYEIRAANSTAALAAGQFNLGDSGKVSSNQSVLVPWSGLPLASRSQVFWQVRVWDKDGAPSAWSDPASFELGLLNPAADWKGQWITVDLPRFDIEENSLAKASWITPGAASNQAIGVRFELDLPTDAKIVGATIDAISDGLVSLYANGKSTLQGPTSHTAPFHADFGQQLVPGKNLIALGAAAVRGSRGGGQNAIAAHGVVELDNGTKIEFNTDGAWKAAVVATPAAGRRGGPAPAVAPANPASLWHNPSFDDSAWTPATVVGLYSAAPLTDNNSGTLGPGRYLRKTFTVKGPVARARLYSTALGTYEAALNGHPVNDHQLDPGFTDYTRRVLVQATDVTNLLQPGQNTLGAVLSDGWFAGRLGWMGLGVYKQISDHSLFRAQLEITYADGTTDIIPSDATWKGGSGEILGSDEQLGEVIDARKAVAWSDPAFNDSAWANTTVEDHPTVELDPQVGPPVRKLMELTPKKITRQGNVWLVDFGQNMVGHVRLSARGPAGTTIEVTHGEMLNPDGTLFHENLRTAISLDTFTLKGGGAPETFEPLFTFHGFRYAALTGYPGNLTADNIRGVVVGSDLPVTGTWESSDKELNQLYSNIIWGQRGNFLSIPTDCPQRDERLGWMGDAQVFSPTAARNADVAGFFTKWMRDVDDAQRADGLPDAGAFSTVAPRAGQADAYPVWGDAGVIVPWNMYLAYGDKKFLEDNYPYMARWVGYLARNANNNIVTITTVGDHLAPVATPTPIMDTAYYANSVNIVAKTAALLGRTDDAAAYAKLHDAIVASFDSTFVGDDGSITAEGGGGRGGFGGAGGAAAGAAPAGAAPATPPRSGNTQTAYILALKFDLLPENLRPVVAQRLADDVVKNQHLTTGFVGSSLLCPMLTQIGRSDLAWQLVFTDTYPSWLFSVKNGATTIWERWDAWTPDKGFQDSSMNSFNHYSFGAVGTWFYTGAGGILPDDNSPGYKHFFLQPQFSTRLDQLAVTLDSPYGTIASAWHTTGDNILYDCTVPPNSSATLTLPAPPDVVLQLDQPTANHVAKSTPITTIPLPAGTYHFSFPRSSIK
jgi:alpha-L-rhamnosidase